MTGADVLLAVLALGVAMLLARGSHPVVAALLVASALAVSAMLFLPTAMLGDWLGMDRVHRLYGLTRDTPLDPPEWIHLFAFAWLGLLVWLARKDVRNGWGVLLVAAFGVAAELSQWLTDGRQPKLEDAALNVLGGLAGVLLAWIGCSLMAAWGRRSGR
ncbi:VanZ family protein [Luteimonas sp. MC1572]|uniref:VanZ family protein n=1 Tax=Luteimonas sp. MC1572 TaxID=2799325 RepID=UPI0018F089C6|nr:VanZ family protein [Luteimonas sp. MC1572]MBJ6980338.1 VanZ family protein [Luteimonas sp. MC1572]QQO04224.1 VanZ family protein [Luteimonas sp. MC1572]